MKTFFSYLLVILVSVSVLSSCQNEKLLITFDINTEKPNPFGWPARLDTVLIIGESQHELTAGKTNCGAWLAYRHLPEHDSVYEIWVDQDNDGSLSDEHPFILKYGEQKTGISVLMPQQASYDSLPYSIAVRGRPGKPSMYWKPNYHMEGQLIYEGDTIDLTIWDSNGNGFFERRDAKGGFNFTGEGFSNINAIMRVGDNHYVLDTLMPDGKVVKLRKTKLEPTELGGILPAFELDLINGEQIDNREYDGQWTMYNFCRECIGSHCFNIKKETMDYFQNYGDTVKLATFIVTSQTDNQTLTRDISDLKLPGDVALLHEQSELWQQAGSIETCQMNPPFRFLVDPDGIIRAAGRQMNLLFKGQRFPDFYQVDTSGTLISGSDYLGSPILIDFWASWCEPCLKEMPTLREVASNYMSKGLQILMISFDNNRDNWLEAIDQHKLPGVHLSDLQGWNSQVGKKYGVISIPFNVLINRNGIIVDMNLRGEDLKKAVKKLLE